MSRAAVARILRLISDRTDRHADRADGRFFQGNIVQDYNQERAIADGVNVGFQVYQIETEVTGKGATLKKEP